ncbi:MAG TPA: hypothetical protein VFV49_02135 [Thermoanaerobaculia bacterium]|nr:hypothetical protein [Thermoanaerobaculia bacterium]
MPKMSVLAAAFLAGLLSVSCGKGDSPDSAAPGAPPIDVAGLHLEFVRISARPIRHGLRFT